MSKYDPIPSTATPRLSLEPPDGAPRAIQLDSPHEPLTGNGALPETGGRGSTDSDESDLVYRDAVDNDIVDEKRALRQDDGSDARWEGEGGMENGFQGYSQSTRLRPRKRSKRVLAALMGVIVLALTIGALAGSYYTAPAYAVVKGSKHITMDHIFNGTFAPQTKTLAWLKEAPDGTFSRLDDEHNIILSTVDSMNTSRLLVNSSLVVDEQGDQLVWQDWHLSADGDYVLFRTNTMQQWRHSTRGNYWVHRLSDGSTFPLVPPTPTPQVSIALWSPKSHSLAYVLGGDVFLVLAADLGTPHQHSSTVRITDDGSDTVFNGVPDWVYEEEVLEGDKALWWSPDANSLAYLRSDETNVRNYRIPIYNPTNDSFAVNPYTSELDMKYPKPGTPNPLVTVHTFVIPIYTSTHSVAQAKHSLSWSGEMDPSERIITEVGWVGDDSLLVKEIDRSARQGKVIIFENGTSEGQVTRTIGEQGEEGDDGWIDHGQNVIPVRSPQQGYLDVVPKDGFNHIALFSPVDSATPIWLTKGDWGEVTEIAGIDEEGGLVYFVAAAPSIDRHLYSVPLPSSDVIARHASLASRQEESGLLGVAESLWQGAGSGDDAKGDLTPLTDVSSPGYYDISLSPQGGYYVLSFKGPGVPWQRVISARAPAEHEGKIQLLEGNEALNKTLGEFARPIIDRTTVKVDDYELNMLELMPSTLDTSGRKKYPVLIRVYGGPGSQMVSNAFANDWHTYLVTELKYIVIMVDGRGTGFAGRQLRNQVRDDLGHWEVVDQIAVAREMTKRTYVDTKRIGIWGWSYGGYMTCKTVEADSGVFTLGMAVAPVTNWLYYDSIYTERYMSTPANNPDGYIRSAVNNVTAFGKVDFLLAHGTGDDNVHFANSASLVDKLTQSGVRGWRFRMFTDSNHSMNKRNGYREVYEWMTEFLIEKWGRGPIIRHA